MFLEYGILLAIKFRYVFFFLIIVLFYKWMYGGLILPFSVSHSSCLLSDVTFLVIKVAAKGLNPGLIVLLLVVGLLLIFLVGNYALYLYARKTLPPRKKKPISKKKMKREKLKQGVSAPGE